MNIGKAVANVQFQGCNLLNWRIIEGESLAAPARAKAQCPKHGECVAALDTRIGTDIRNSSVLPLEPTLGYLGGYDAAIAGIGERTGYQKWITPDCFQFVIGKISGIVTDNLLHEFGTHVLVEEDCSFLGILDRKRVV